MTHIGTEINACCAAARVLGRIGAASADTDVVFFRRGHNDMTLHNDLAFFVQDCEVGCAGCARDQNKQAGRVHHDAEMRGIADNDAYGVPVQPEQFRFFRGEAQHRMCRKDRVTEFHRCRSRRQKILRPGDGRQGRKSGGGKAEHKNFEIWHELLFSEVKTCEQEAL